MKPTLIQSNGIRLAAESVGDPSDPPILLIMGAMASGVWWPVELCRELAARGRFVIRYDHRDTGASTSYEPGTAPYDVEDLAEDAMHVLDGYGISQAHVVGMSLGGYIAQLLALKYPDRVLSITMISSEPLATSDPNIPKLSQSVLDYHARAAELDWSNHDEVLEYQIGAWRLLSGTAYEFDPELIRDMAEADLARTPNPLTAFNHGTLGGGEAWIDRLDEIAVPSLIIHGTEDIVLPYAHARALHAALAGSRLVTLQGVGHELPRGAWPVIIDELVAHTARE